MGLMSPSIRKVFPSIHPYLNIRDLGSLENLKARVDVLKILPTFLNPKKINNEAKQEI
jgi:hypothetical protein